MNSVKPYFFNRLFEKALLLKKPHLRRILSKLRPSRSQIFIKFKDRAF